MQTVDDLLHHIVKQSFGDPFNKIESKDKKILISLNKQITEGSFLTEKQGNFLLRILNFYRTHFDANINSIIESKLWSSEFRILKNTKKVSISDDKIIIEFSYDRDIKKKVLSTVNLLKGNYELHSPSVIKLDLNEKNVLLIVNKLKSENFEISKELEIFYKQINLIIEDKQQILNSTVCYNDYFSNIIKKDIINSGDILDTKILDRRIRHQYRFEATTMSNELHFQIAHRPSVNVFINQTNYSINDVLQSLHKLERLPVLVIFDNRNVKQCIEYLEKIVKFESKGTKGIYFRFDNNSEENKLFNSLIHQHSFNAYLDSNTEIAVISNNTLPKFLIKNGWRPKSVISFTNSFRNNKSHVFCNDVDLKIYYNNAAPVVIGDLYEIM
jgi:hypothetical protein